MGNCKGENAERGDGMKNAIVVEPSDIKKILADKYNVPKSNIIKSQYTYTVILEEEKCGE